jgi:N-formylglutamate amidohydrolase
MSIFDSEVRDTILFHIPHSSEYIPNWDGYLIGRVQLRKQIKILTDLATERIFSVNGIKPIIFPYNRFFCDVERLIENEPMLEKGMGIYYTNDIYGNPLRLYNKQVHDIVMTLYKQHHITLLEETNKKLIKYGVCRIIDCHSFNNKPLKIDLNKDENRPDICLGVDDFHTPHFMIEYFKAFFEKNGLSVKINEPYSGTMIPSYYYKKKADIQGIMIEINKKLYMTEKNFVIDREVQNLNKLIHTCFSNF